MSWQSDHADRELSHREAIAKIPKGQHVFIASGAAEPVGLVHELVAQADRFADNVLVHLLTLGPAPYVEPRYRDHFRHNAFFIGHNVREAVAEGRADYTPVFLSQIPSLIRARRMPVDVALIQVSPPNRYGYVNVGVSVDIVMAAIESAKLVIAEVNPRMPVVNGDGFLPVDRLDAWVAVDRPIIEVPKEPLDESAREIGRNVASLIEDGATLQMGIGQIPDAVLEALTDKRDLGIWTEMFSDGILPLVENGNINGKQKTYEPGKITSSFTFGTQRIYDFVHDNPLVVFHPSDHVNDPVRIARQHRMVAINSALQIDLTGQVCADSIGCRFYSGIGGQVDFIRGASMCPGGKPIIAIRSTAKGGEISRLVATLDPGAGVVTSRGDVRFVVTEYGVADLQGKSVRERAMSLIAIAHPDHRAELLSAAKARRYVFADMIAPKAPYPAREVRRLTTKSGKRLTLRPLRVDDEDKLHDLFYALSEDTVYRRWLRVVKRMPHHDLLGDLDLDYDQRMAFVVEHRPGEGEPEIVALARYATDRATGYADVAFVVRDDWQNEGIGTALMSAIARYAKSRGVAGLSADVLATNSAMLKVFHKSGLTPTTTLEGGVYELTMPLGDPAPAPSRRGS